MSAETIWTPALKMIFGMGVGAGLFALGRHFLPAMKFSVQGLPGELALNQATLLAPAIGSSACLADNRKKAQLGCQAQKQLPAPKVRFLGMLV